MQSEDDPVDSVDPDDVAPDEDEEGDEVDPDLKDLATTKKKDIQDDEVDTQEPPRTTENRRASQ
jgi:hypothetical protein